jgi:hypothetical protein
MWINQGRERVTGRAHRERGNGNKESRGRGRALSGSRSRVERGNRRKGVWWQQLIQGERK